MNPIVLPMQMCQPTFMEAQTAQLQFIWACTHTNFISTCVCLSICLRWPSYAYILLFPAAYLLCYAGVQPTDRYN